MSDPAFLTYEFSKSLPRPQLLTEIGQGIRGVKGQIDQRNMEGQYNQALNTALQNPTQQNISQLYQIAEPLGRFGNARTAIQDLFNRMQQPGAEAAPGQAIDPNLAAYSQALEAWEQDPLNPELRQNLQETAINADRFDETQEIITGRTEEVTQQQLRRTENLAQSEYFSDPTPENRNEWLSAAREAGTFKEAEEIIANMTEEERLADVKEGLNIFGPLAHGAPDLALDHINRSIGAYRAQGDEASVQAYQDIKDLVEDGRIQEAMGILGTTLGAFEEGRQGMDTALAMAANRREGESHVSSMLNRAIETELANEEMRQRLQEVWADSPILDFGLGSVLIDMAQVFESNDLTGDQQINAVRSLRNQYLGETERYQDINEQGALVRQAALRGMVASNLDMEDAVGAADLALVNAFQRMIDPATVRESDIQNLRSTIGGFAQVQQWVDQFRTGSKFSPEQRQTIMSVASQLMGTFEKVETRARDFVDTYAPRIGEDPIDVIGERIFKPYNKEQQLEEYKGVLVGMYPRFSDRIRSIDSLEELERQFEDEFEVFEGAAVAPEAGGTGTGTGTGGIDWGEGDWEDVD